MSSEGPIIEELPDDYDIPPKGGVTAEANIRERGSQSSGPLTAASSSSSSGGAGAGLRKGFFSASSSSSSSTGAGGLRKRAQPAKSAECASGSDGGGPAGSREGVATELPPPIERPSSTAQGAKAAALSQITPTEVADGLRARLRTAANAAEEAFLQEAEAAVTVPGEELQTLLNTAALEARWPPRSARESWAKATAEINGGLAELRATSNDARRLRSGDEKRAIAEVRRAADDAFERLKKAAESVVRKDEPAKKAGEREAEAMAVFRDLPLTAKLRVLADERLAIAVLIASFGAGMAVMFGILAEVYTAWNCSFRC
eukprot:gnl/TRDRNA2_/TRDRNA2_183168_c0_seq1.p1 gnl/TRDRNA2_/TRDRNA2_183168_c0~~gnl/TRDRNA2_/TRDRNA2_183168_c0_seq1.p1  ORF type:complete len:317 (+),score=75.85 gnl/TRDRNA2_/TRDRNA2_183168_c0_seq1:79-1029(+)